jgi:hypothetical protein
MLLGCSHYFPLGSVWLSREQGVFCIATTHHLSWSGIMSYPQSVQVDPLDSPHPIPWSWVMATLSAVPTEENAGLYYYRSQSLLSPDGQYAAYSRIQMQVKPVFFQSCVSSVLFVENLRTGDLQAVTPASPLANNPFVSGAANQLGSISIVIPVSWSESGDRLLAREFESLFCSDIASDYAVIVDRKLKQVSTVAPTRMHYTTAVLLGWSQAQPNQALFRAGNLGEENWNCWTVDATGHTVLAEGDRSVTFGQPISSVWMGPQVQS